MCRKFFIVILAFFSAHSYSLAQDFSHEMSNYKVDYTFSYATDTLTNDRSTEPYVLIAYENESQFLNGNSHLYDSLCYDFEQKYGPVKTQEDVDRFSKVVFFGGAFKSSKTDLRVKKVSSSNFMVVLPVDFGRYQFMHIQESLKWTMLDETADIAGISCRKATTLYGGRQYIAWYATSIPIADGPYVFQGLPGLILKVRDTKGLYDFEVVEFDLNPKERLKSPMLNRHVQKVLDRKTFVNKCRDFQTNPRMHKAVIDPDPDSNIKMKRAYKTRLDLLIESY